MSSMTLEETGFVADLDGAVIDWDGAVVGFRMVK